MTRNGVRLITLTPSRISSSSLLVRTCASVRPRVRSVVGMKRARLALSAAARPPAHSLSSVSPIVGSASRRAFSDVINVTFVDKFGKSKAVKAHVGDSLLDVAHEYSMDIEGAVCGRFGVFAAHQHACRRRLRWRVRLQHVPRHSAAKGLRFLGSSYRRRAGHARPRHRLDFNVRERLFRFCQLTAHSRSRLGFEIKNLLEVLLKGLGVAPWTRGRQA